MFHRIYLPKNVDVVVASFGGVGTTFLCDFLSQYRKTNDSHDADGIKHSPLPPITRNSSTRFVYVFGDPVDAAVSLFRRGFHAEQSRKLQRYAVNPVALPREMSVDDYAQAGVDRFLFERHFMNWYSTWLRVPTLFLRYEAVFDNKQAILDFLNLPAEAMNAFPQKRERSTSSIQLSAETSGGLESMYGGLRKILADVADAEVRQPVKTEPAPSWACPDYRRAIKAQYSPHNLLRAFWETRLRTRWKKISQGAAG